MKPAESLAHRLFLASGDGPGPLALKIVQRGKGDALILTIEALGRLPAIREQGVFCSLVAAIDPTDEGVFVDFADVEAHYEYARNIARQGLTLCDVAQGREAPPVALELLSRLVLWRLTVDSRQLFTPAAALARLARVDLSEQPHFNVEPIVTAVMFGRPGDVPPAQRQAGVLYSFFKQHEHELGLAIQNHAASFYAPHRKVATELRKAEELLKIRQAHQGALEGGSLNPDYRYIASQTAQAQELVDDLRRQEADAQRACWLAQTEAAGRRRQELYAAPAPEPAPAAPPPVDAPPPAPPASPEPPPPALAAPAPPAARRARGAAASPPAAPPAAPAEPPELPPAA